MHRQSQNQQPLSRSGRVSPPLSLLGATSAASAATDDTLTTSSAQRLKESPKQPDNNDAAGSIFNYSFHARSARLHVFRFVLGGGNAGQPTVVESGQTLEHPQIVNFAAAEDVEFGHVPTSQPIDNVLQQQMSQLNLDYTAQQQVSFSNCCQLFLLCE